MNSHLNFILDIRLIRYTDLVDSVIKHAIAVGLGNITTTNKGKELKSVVTNDTTYRYNGDKPLTQTLNSYII